MILATIYSWPLWQHILRYFLPPAFTLWALVVWTLTSRRWVRYVCWLIVALTICGYVRIAAVGRLRYIFPRTPDASVYDPRWWISYYALSLAWTVFLFLLSSPIWRKWLRHKLGLKGDKGRRVNS